MSIRKVLEEFYIKRCLPTNEEEIDQAEQKIKSMLLSECPKCGEKIKWEEKSL